MSNLTKYFPAKSTDISLAYFLTASGALGVPANILSCYCFWRTRVSRRTNNSYFKAIYMTITVVDSLICLFQVPVIESLISGRMGRMFGHVITCKAWVIVWRSLTMTSVFLVAQLSLSRLALLVNPQHQMSFQLVLLPVAAFGLVVAAFCLTLFSEFINIEYFPQVTGICIVVGGGKNFNYTEAFLFPEPIPSHVVRADIVSHILSSCSIAGPFIPILISFTVSLIYLNRAKNTARNTRANAKMHIHATNTIIFVTLVYLVCNDSYLPGDTSVPNGSSEERS